MTAQSRRRARLRLRKSALGPTRAGARRRRRRGDRRRRCGDERRRSGGARRRRIRGMHGGPAARSAARRSSPTGSPRAARCSGCASACRSCSHAGSSSAWRRTGCGQWPGAVVRLDAPVIPHMGWNVVDAPLGYPAVQGARRRHPVLLRPLLCRAAVGGQPGCGADVGHPHRAVPGRRRGRTAGRHPVPPGEERRRGCLAFGQLG